MKRSAHAAVRDPSRRAQRIQLLQHDVPTLEVPAPAGGSAAASSAPVAISDATLSRLVDERLQGLLPELLARKVSVHREELTEEVAAASLQAVETANADVRAAEAVQAASAATGTAPVSKEAASPVSASPPAAAAPPKQSATAEVKSSATTPNVRVVARNPISGAAAMGDSAPSLARKASPQSNQPALAPRCFAHAGQHYLGASEDDVIAAWSAMRERFRLTPENKTVARRALLDWLQRTRTVCASNIHWYGDFVAVRSCPVRVLEDHPGHGVDGWFLLFDPNGESFLRAPLFAEAFDAPDARHSGVVPQMARPAWIAEERRAAAAARHGGELTRPFSPETADDLTSNDFFRGLAE